MVADRGGRAADAAGAAGADRARRVAAAGGALPHPRRPLHLPRGSRPAGRRADRALPRVPGARARRRVRRGPGRPAGGGGDLGRRPLLPGAGSRSLPGWSPALRLQPRRAGRRHPGRGTRGGGGRGGSRHPDQLRVPSDHPGPRQPAGLARLRGGDAGGGGGGDRGRALPLPAGGVGELGPREGFTSSTSVADANGRVLGHSALAVLEGMLPPATALEFAGAVESGASLALWERRAAGVNGTASAALARFPSSGVRRRAGRAGTSSSRGSGRSGCVAGGGA